MVTACSLSQAFGKSFSPKSTNKNQKSAGPDRAVSPSAGDDGPNTAVSPSAMHNSGHSAKPKNVGSRFTALGEDSSTNTNANESSNETTNESTKGSTNEMAVEKYTLVQPCACDKKRHCNNSHDNNHDNHHKNRFVTNENGYVINIVIGKDEMNMICMLLLLLSVFFVMRKNDVKT